MLFLWGDGAVVVILKALESFVSSVSFIMMVNIFKLKPR